MRSMSRWACRSFGRRSITGRHSTSRASALPIRKAWWRRFCWLRSLPAVPSRLKPKLATARRHSCLNQNDTLRAPPPSMKEKPERELAQTNIAENRKAFHDFHLLESFEAGIVLLGTEVKAIREGRVSLRDR